MVARRQERAAPPELLTDHEPVHVQKSLARSLHGGVYLDIS